MNPIVLNSSGTDYMDYCPKAITFQEVLTFFSECKYDKEKKEWYRIKSDIRYWFDDVERKVYAYDRKNRCYSLNVEEGKYNDEVQHQHTDGCWIDSSEVECLNEWLKLECGELGENSFQRLVERLMAPGTPLNHFDFLRIENGNEQVVSASFRGGKRFLVTIVQDGRKCLYGIVEDLERSLGRGYVPLFADDAKRCLRVSLKNATNALASEKKEDERYQRRIMRELLEDDGIESGQDDYDEPYYVDGCPVYGVDDEEDAEITYWNTH